MLRKTWKTFDKMVKNNEISNGKACLDNIRVGIKHVHSLGIAHCEIKPHNMFPSIKDFVTGNFNSCTLEINELGQRPVLMVG
jgi:serine/threonine protein kinase